MAREIITHPALPDASEHGYSHAIVTDGRLYMSGQVGMDADRNLAGENITAQARQAFSNVESICEAVDKELEDIVKVTAHIVDPHSRFADYQSVWYNTFTDPYPCHTVLGVEQLAGPEYLIELEIELPLDE
ncbi:RidA family protein [Natrialbaceae archaeon A-CW1-1]